MTKESILSLDDVSFEVKIKKTRFKSKRFKILKNISFDIYRGETLGVVGRNGAGKSTLLQLMSGITQPTEGRLKKAEHVTTSLLSLQLGFSWDISGRDNAIFGAMLLGHTKKEALAKLDSIIEFSELEKWIDEPLKTYSAGMRARLGFAVAMEMEPDILLIDEALGVGDESFRKKSSEAILSKIHSNQTVVFVSHTPGIVQQLCTRSVWLDKGQVKKVGDTAEVLDAYHSSLTQA